MERELTCIICPKGCTIQIEMSSEKEILNVTGNHCKRGDKYARAECTNPQRTITTTLRCENGEMISVKTDRTIPKEKMFEAMEIINKIQVKLPVRIGDVLKEDVFGSRILATQNRLQ